MSESKWVFELSFNFDRIVSLGMMKRERVLLNIFIVWDEYVKEMFAFAGENFESQLKISYKGIERQMYEWKDTQKYEYEIYIYIIPTC